MVIIYYDYHDCVFFKPKMKQIANERVKCFVQCFNSGMDSIISDFHQEKQQNFLDQLKMSTDIFFHVTIF